MLQLYWIPIRDWNLPATNETQEQPTGCNYIESLLGIETPDSSWYVEMISRGCNYIESLLGIETDKFSRKRSFHNRLQLYWIPIRDWNLVLALTFSKNFEGCNYIESLLGIETLGVLPSSKIA